jgi:hypothetical protein
MDGRRSLLALRCPLAGHKDGLETFSEAITDPAAAVKGWWIEMNGVVRHIAPAQSCVACLTCRRCHCCHSQRTDMAVKSKLVFDRPPPSPSNPVIGQGVAWTVAQEMAAPARASHTSRSPSGPGVVLVNSSIAAKSLRAAGMVDTAKIADTGVPRLTMMLAAVAGFPSCSVITRSSIGASQARSAAAENRGQSDWP